MKKIPTLFRRDPADMRRVLPEVTPGCEWVLAGEGVATRKYDGTCVLIRRDGLAVHAFARREVKPGKTPPPNWVEVDHDDTTGKRMGWEPAEQSGFAKWITAALDNMLADGCELLPGTYELIGPRVQGNPEQWDMEWLVRHDEAEVLSLGFALDGEHAFEKLGIYLRALGHEGIVWHHPDGRMVKIKARDFPEGDTP